MNCCVLLLVAASSLMDDVHWWGLQKIMQFYIIGLVQDFASIAQVIHWLFGEFPAEGQPRKTARGPREVCAHTFCASRKYSYGRTDR